MSHAAAGQGGGWTAATALRRMGTRGKVCTTPNTNHQYLASPRQAAPPSPRSSYVGQCSRSARPYRGSKTLGWLAWGMVPAFVDGMSSAPSRESSTSIKTNEAEIMIAAASAETRHFAAGQHTGRSDTCTHTHARMHTRTDVRTQRSPARARGEWQRRTHCGRWWTLCPLMAPHHALVAPHRTASRVACPPGTSAARVRVRGAQSLAHVCAPAAMRPRLGTPPHPIGPRWLP